MKLKDLNISPDMAVTSPLLSSSPDKKWIEAHERKLIPTNLYVFYVNNNCFSLNIIPNYFDNGNCFMFGYLKSIIIAMFSSFIEINNLTDELKLIYHKGYSPIKRIKDIPYDKNVDDRITLLYKYYVISVVSILDQFSELVALILTNTVKGLKVGKASFTKILITIDNCPREGNHAEITELKKSCISMLIEKIKPMLSDDNRRMIDLIYLHRNKLTHLGCYTFPIFSLHDEEGLFYKFLPSVWPINIESGITISDRDENDHSRFNSYIKNFANIDIIELIKEVHSIIIDLMNDGFSVLNTSYDLVKNLPFNKEALKQINSNREKINFTTQ
ncbi:MAG: hypothetical protein P9X24_01780 [Candidatus Hatepunaea meridiana]|nr:hypothetical protein [Candidatus Hatepunaea meridiana]